MRTFLASKLSLSLAALLVAGAIIACSSSETPATGSGDSGAPDPDAAVADDTSEPEAAAPFKLTSTAYAEGETIPTDQTCTGKEVSPPLAWGPGPDGTKSYAIIFIDDTITFLHSITYDIPVTANALPGSMPKTYQPPTPAGTKQTKSYLGSYGYAGPCPPSGVHTYELILHAIDVETLPGATQTMTLDEAEALITKHSLKSTKLTGTYKKP